MNKNFGLVIVICIIAFYIILNNTIFIKRFFPSISSELMTSKIDGEKYYVQKNFQDKQLAVDTLAKLHILAISLLYHMKKYYPTSPLTIRLLERYDPNKKSENHPINADNSTSYTLNKESFSFCIRNKKTLKIHNINDLSFVLLHEITHQSVDVTGHPSYFWSAFKTILQIGAKAKLYIPIDYSRYPFIYCGLPVKYNPLFDPNLPTIHHT